MPISEKFIQRWGQVTEEYSFYQGEVILRYDVKAHKYFLIKDGDLELQDGVTSICHIIDKSEVLMNWAVKVMAQKALDTTPTFELPTGDRFVPQMAWSEYEKIILEAKKAKDEHLETAGGIGHEAHDWVEKLIKATLAGNESRRLELLAKFPDDERAMNACLAALEWMSKHNVRWRATEQKIYSRQYRYAGTMDGLAMVDSCDNPKCCPKQFKDRLSIIDWKTSNSLYLEYLLQTAAYQRAFNEMEMYRLGMNELKYWLSDHCATDRWVIRLGKDNAEFDPWHMTLADFEQDFECFKDAFTLGRHVDAIKARIKAKEDAARDARKAVRDAARAAKELAEAAQKAEAKEKKVQARIESMAKACNKSKAFKGSKFPTCETNAGGPCQACMAIYTEKCSQKEINSSQIEDKPAPVKTLKKDSLKSLLELIKPKEHELVPVITAPDGFSMYPPTGPIHTHRVRAVQLLLTSGS
jgi:hypothetical protein